MNWLLETVKSIQLIRFYLDPIYNTKFRLFIYYLDKLCMPVIFMKISNCRLSVGNSSNDISLLNNEPLKIECYLSRHLFDKFGSNILSNSILEVAFNVQY